MAEARETREEKFVKQLNFSSSHLASDWQTFKSQFNIYRIAKRLAAMNEEEQIANLLVLMGSDSVLIYDQFTFDEENEAEAKTLANVIRKFDAHFEPVKNVIYERVKFNSLKQGDLPIHQFITQLQTQADKCDYGDMKDELIRDRIVVGVTDDKLREYLIDLEDLNLQRCITKSKQYVSHHAQSTVMVSKGDNVDAVVQERGRTPKTWARRSDRMVKRVAPENERRFSEPKGKCMFCNRENHSRDCCPARKSMCRDCNKKGHWAKSKACSYKSSVMEEVDEADEIGGLFLGSDSD
jgi:hypothetical protein